MSEPTNPAGLPETYEVTVGDTVVRLTRSLLADVPPGTLVTRRPAHQLFEELTGADAYDLVTGVALRSARPLDLHLAESLVWRLDIGGPSPKEV